MASPGKRRRKKQGEPEPVVEAPVDETPAKPKPKKPKRRKGLFS